MAWDVSAELESVAQPKGLLGGLTPHPRLEIFTFWMCICAHTYPSTNIHKGEQVTPPPKKDSIPLAGIYIYLLILACQRHQCLCF